MPGTQVRAWVGRAVLGCQFVFRYSFRPNLTSNLEQYAAQIDKEEALARGLGSWGMRFAVGGVRCGRPLRAQVQWAFLPLNPSWSEEKVHNYGCLF